MQVEAAGRLDAKGPNFQVFVVDHEVQLQPFKPENSINHTF
jgi:hypothetical protein